MNKLHPEHIDEIGKFLKYATAVYPYTIISCDLTIYKIRQNIEETYEITVINNRSILRHNGIKYTESIFNACKYIKEVLKSLLASHDKKTDKTGI